MIQYQHTQRAWLMMAALFTVALATMLLPAQASYSFLLAIIFALLGIIFGKLTAIVTENYVKASFGLSLFSRKIPFEDIETTEVVRNLWLMGWGIRFIGNGTMFNVSGLDAVELRLKNGKVFRIGTDEPQRLNEAILLAMSMYKDSHYQMK